MKARLKRLPFLVTKTNNNQMTKTRLKLECLSKDYKKIQIYKIRCQNEH